MANPSLKELYDSGLFEEIGGEENNTISLPGYDSAPGYDTSTPSPIKQTGFEKLNTPAAMPVELQQRRSDNDLFKRVLSISGGKYNQDASGVLFTPKDETHLKNTLSSLDSSGVPFKAQSQPDGSFLFTLTNKSGAGMVQGDAGSSGGSGPGFDTFQSVPAGSTHNPSLQSLLDSGMFEEYRVGDGQFDYDQKEMEVGSNGPKKPGLLKTAGKGLIHSALGLGESIGTGLEYLENRLDPTENKTNHWGLGETAKRFWRKQADKFLPSEEIYGKNIVDNPELLANAEWWAYNVADMMPALAASIIPGSIAFKGAQAVPILAKAAPLIGSVAGGLSGGALEGTQTYNAVLEKGGTEEEAARAGELMTAGSAVLNAFSVGKVLSKAGNTFKGKVLKHLGAGAWEGITEGLEEPTEVFAKYFGAYLAGEQLPNDLTSQLIDSAKEALTVAPIAAVTGFGGSVMSGDHATSKEKLDSGPDNIKTPESAQGDIDIQVQPGPADGSPSPSPAAGIQEQPGSGLVDTVPVDTAPIQNSEPRQHGVPFFDPVEEFRDDIQPGQKDIQFKDSTVNLSDTHKEIAKDAIREVFSEIANESEKFGDFIYDEQVNQFEKNLRQANDEIKDYSIPDVRPEMTPAQNEAIGRMEQAELETEARRISAGIENNEDPFLNQNRENPQQSVSLQSTQQIVGKEQHPVGGSTVPVEITTTVKEKLTVAPGAPVTWQDKKGNMLSGVLVKKRYKDKPIWRVKKADGKTMFVSEKDFQVRPSEKLFNADASKIRGSQNQKYEPQTGLPLTDAPQNKNGSGTTYTNDNTSIDFNYEVIEADDLITSHDDNMSVNPNFPEKLQPRERSRKASLMQVENIANKLNPARLGESANVAQGAPMIGKYSNVVESGNGRTLAIRKAYANGETGSEYKAWLQKNADFFGLQSGKVNRMEKPVLVRRRQTDIDNITRFTQQANEADTAKLSSTEQAVVDAGNLSQDDIAMFRSDQDGNIMAASNKGFIDLFLDKMSPEEKSGYLTEDGRANKQLVDRVQAAVFQKAYANQELLKLSAEEANPDIKNILNGLVGGASNFVKARGLDDRLADTGIIEDIVGGIELLRRAKREYPDVKAGNGKTTLQAQLRQTIDQGDLFGDGPSEEVKLIANFLADNIRSGKRIGEFFDSIGTRLRAYISDLSQSELFGTKKKLTSYDLINQSKEFLNDKYEDKQGNLFEEQADKSRSAGSETGDLARGNEGRDEDPGGTGESTQEVTSAEYGSKNKIFTKDVAEKARELLRKKLSGNQLNSGIDPEILLAGIQLAGYHVEAGARSFADYSKAMIQDVGETVKPYLRSFYEGVRYFPEFDPAGMTDAKDIDDSTRKTDNTDIPTNKERENVPQHDTGTDTERDRGDSGAIDGLGKKNVSYGSGPATGTDGEGVRPTVETGGTGSSQISSGHETSPAGKRGDQSPYSTDGPVGSEGRNAGSDNDTRGGDVGFNGGQPDRIPAETVVNAAQKRDDFKSKITAQKRAANVKTVHADLSNIQETLPLLHPGQQEDVLFAEKRFSKPDGHGVMYTNGTGTGKTFSALGIIKRFERDGKKNILVIAPDNVIINAWTNAASLFDIHMHKLADTKDAGQDVTITTYANFRDNQKLVSRDWDLVIADESHELSMNKSGGKTSSLAMFRAITKNPRGVQNRAALLFPRLFNKRGDSKKNHEAWTKVLDKVRNDIAMANKNGSRSKAVFLSATPFAYEKNIDYAEGYLFDYGPERDDLAYNATDAYQQFMVEHFGYRMRYNKLTEPDAEVNRGLMQRQFNSWLKQQGVLSSRVLSVDYDYDRRFVLTESAIGQKIDDGFEFLRENYKEYAELLSYIQDDFDYLQRRYLLEAIKAKEVVPIIKDHLAHGRKVVVFHDYIKGGAHNPFDVSSIIDQKTTEGAVTGLAEQAKKFAAARPDLVNLPIDHLPSPLTMLQRSFPDLLVVNGQTVSKKEMQKNINAFNDDATGPCVLMVQSDKDKGWSGHDTTGKHQRVLINLGLPTRPTRAIQQEGRIYRVGQASDAIFRYLNTGTNWERWAFASTIAKRASAAENLAMGEEARALQDSFINAFEESDIYPVGMDGEGKGGKAQDIANNAALTEWDRAMSFYFGQQKKTARTKAAEGQDYFATPEPLGLKMVEWAGIESGDSVLEPSAGHGAIARWFPENIDATVIEPSAELSSRLKMVTPDSKVIQDNFESHHVTNKYDAVIMNPPFGTAGKTAMEHVEKAFKHLRHGGRVVAIIPNGPAMEKRLDKFLYGEDDKGKVINSNAHLTADFILPAATFERAGTKVSSRVVVIDKTLDTGLIQQTKKDFSDISDVKEFFNRIKETDVPGRGETDSKKSEAKYSVSPNLNTTVKPEQVLTRQDILSAFPGQTSLINPDNSISIRLDNGQGLKINTVEHIGGDDYRLAVQYGRMDKNGVILGKYQDRTITLNKNLATNFTINHEVYHFLVDMGMITDRERLLLRSEHGKMVKSGTARFKSSDIREENEANTFAQILKDRAAYRGTKLGSLIQKVADFIDGLLHVGRASVRKLAREVESGEVYGRPADDQGKENKAPSFSTTDDFHKQFEEDETNAFKTGLDYFTGMVKHFRENPDNDVEDIHAVAHILKTTMYNAEKIGGAYKRLFDVMRKRNDYKVEKQNELWKAGERSLLEELSLIYKNDKAAAAELNTYLVDKDIAAQGFTIKKKDGEYHLFHWKKEKNGERKLIGSFSSEDQAERVSILTEASESELSENAKTGLVLFRQMSHNLYHHFASDIEQIIKAHEEAGEPAPQVVIQTQDGTTKVDLKVAAAMMGDRRGYYFPRQRQSGQYMVIMGKDGEADQLQFFDTKMFARGYRSKWEKRGYEQKAFKKVGKISEDLFQSLGSLMDQEAVFNKALEQVTDSARHRNLEDINLTGEWRDKDFVVTGRGLGGVEEEMLKGIGGEYVDRFVGRKYMPMVIFRDVSANQIESLEDKVTKTLLRSKAMFPDMDLAFSKALVQQYDTELKGRGARSRMIGRSDAVGPNVKRGYETNALIAITQAMQAAAGSYAKARIAKKGIAAITGLDISWNDFQQNDKRSKTAAALKLELENLNLASPDQIEHKTVLKQHLQSVRRELESLDALDTDKIIKRQQEVKRLLKEIRSITRWVDADKARNLQAKINEIQTGMHEDYLKQVKERRIDAAMQPTVYEEATTALKDILKNDEAADRIIGTIKGIAVFKYLGFRVSSAAINMTNMVTGVPAAINGETEDKVGIRSALRHIGDAFKDYGLHRAGKLADKDKQLVYDEIREKGWDSPVFNKEAFSILHGKLGRGLSRALETSMLMFGKTEEMNRAATIAGTYFAMKKAYTEKGEAWDHDAMMQAAKNISDKAHGVYGKESMPHHMRGKNIGARVLQMTYVFQTFMHNYLQEMWRLGVNKKQYKAAAYMAFSPAIFGLGATVPMGIAKAIANALDMDDPEEAVIQVAEDNFGTTFGNFARYGITGMSEHGISLKGSLATRFGTPDSVMDLFGAPGSVLGDVFKGYKNLSKGYYMDALENVVPTALGNISKGIREATTGVTTKNGNPVYFGNEKVKGDILDTVLRVMSFNPTHISKKKEIRWNEYRVIQRYKEKKSDLYTQLRRKIMAGQTSREDMIEWEADARDFNTELQSKGILRIVPPITRKSIKSALRELNKAPKRERMRQAVQ